MKRGFSLVIVFAVLVNPLFSQSDTIRFFDEIRSDFYENIEEVIEEKLEELGEDADFSDEVEDLLKYRETLIDVNTMSVETALRILKLTDYQYYQLQLYIDKFGDLVTKQELYAVEGFSEEVVKRIWPLVYVDSHRNRNPFKFLFRNVRQTLLMRYGQIVEHQSGYEKNRETHYLGSPARLAFRYTFESNDVLSVGLSGEKDAGEEFFKGSQKRGFDFYSFHLELKNINCLRKVVVGDYKLNFGQGLVIGSGLLGAKGGGVGACRKFPTGIRAATSLNEGLFFRGVAAEIGSPQYNGIVFYSHNFFDGNLTETDDGDFFDGTISSTGYHRTEKEVLKRNVLKERMYGFHFQVNKKLFRVGLQGVRTEFDATVCRNEMPYKFYGFSGQSNSNLGVDYQVILRKCILFGEWAVDQNWQMALLQGLHWELDARVKMAFLFRHYGKRYSALNSGAFGAHSPNQNETGLYWVSDIVLGPKVEVSVASDLYRFQWLQYACDAPAFGADFSCKLVSNITRRMQLNIRYDYRLKAQNIRGTYLNRIDEMNRHRLKVGVAVTPMACLRLKTGFQLIENVSYRQKHRRFGVALIQDADFSWEKVGLTLKMRLAYFDTDSYDERIYAYESDLLYMFTSVAYFNSGIRGYVMLKYGYKWFDVWLRLSRTFYPDLVSIGSGTEMINANHKTEVKVQVLFKL